MGTGASGRQSLQFVSELYAGPDRFLALVVEQGLESGRIRSEDFVRHFPPTRMMQALAGRPNLRASILTIATGIRSAIALKKSPESAGQDLQIALDEGETDAESVVELFGPDDRVRYLPKPALWALVTEGEPWRADPGDPSAVQSARDFVLFVLEQALADDLIAASDVVEGLTLDALVRLLPRSGLADLLEAVLELGRWGEPFTAEDLLNAATPSVMVEHVPLTTLWEHVIVPKAIEPYGLLEASAADAERARDETAAGHPDATETSSTAMRSSEAHLLMRSNKPAN